MKNSIGGEYETVGGVTRTTQFVRHEFLRLIHEEKPEVYAELKDEIYRLYLAFKKKIESDSSQCDMFDIFRLLEDDAPHHDPQLLALRKALREWSQRWNLDATWCREDAFSEIYKAALNNGKFNDHRWSLMLDSHAADCDTPPPKGLPLWHGLVSESKSEYIEKFRLEALGKIEGDDLLNLSEYTVRNELVDSIIVAAKKYIAEADARYAGNKQLRKISNRPKVFKHLRWTVQVRVGCSSPEEVAQAFETIADKEDLSDKAIKKGVRTALELMGLPVEPTFKLSKGRQQGRKDSPKAPRQLRAKN